MQNHARVSGGRESLEHLFNLLLSALEVNALFRVGVDGEPQVNERIHNIDRLQVRVAVQVVLQEDVTCNREEIGFGVPNLVVAVNAQEAQKHFLRKVSDVRRVSQACGQIPAQAGPVLAGHVGDERCSGVDGQGGSRGEGC